MGSFNPKRVIILYNFDVDRPLGKWLRFVNGCLICFVAVLQDYIGRWSTSFQYCRIVLPYICSINLEIFTRQTGGCLFSLFSVRYRSTRCRWNVSSFFEKISKTLSSSQLTRWLLALHASKQDFVFCAHS